jgi:hypothetical protein
MAMTLIDGRVGREEIKVFVVVDVPYFGAAAFGEYDGKGVVVVSAVFVFEVDVGLGEGGEGRRRCGEGAGLVGEEAA